MEPRIGRGACAHSRSGVAPWTMDGLRACGALKPKSAEAPLAIDHRRFVSGVVVCSQCICERGVVRNALCGAQRAAHMCCVCSSLQGETEFV